MVGVSAAQQELCMQVGTALRVKKTAHADSPREGRRRLLGLCGLGRQQISDYMVGVSAAQ
jgi:hypothetical protein